MKTFETVAAQGEISIRRIDSLPAGLVPRKVTNGRHIIGHSETGHHHTMAAAGVDVLDRADFSTSEGFSRFYLTVAEPRELEHERSHDTHESLLFAPGNYEITINREFDPYAELARQTMD
jgi:hypothetical protein